jgi:PhnB protein
MAADNYSEAPDVVLTGFAVSLSGDDGDALRATSRSCPRTAWSRCPWPSRPGAMSSGMCTDKYGVPWLVNVSQPQ